MLFCTCTPLLCRTVLLKNGDYMKVKIRILAAVMLLIITAVSAVSCTAVQSDVSSKPDGETSSAEENSGSDEKKNNNIPSSFTVIIDPGHGFDDPGSHPEFIYSDEANITLRAALLLRDMLKKSGIKTVLTHDGERFPSVKEIIASADKYNVEYDEEKLNDNDVFSAYERVIYSNILAKELGNCFFVSLHTNSIEDSPSTCGLAIDYYKNSPYNAVLDRFCSDFSDRVSAELGKKTVIFSDDTEEAYIVNKYCLSPSVLIEMGYGSNRQDGSDLMNSVWLEQFCDMLAKCIAENKELLQK